MNSYFTTIHATEVVTRYADRFFMRKVLLFAPVLAVLALVAQQSAIFPVLKSTVLHGETARGLFPGCQ